MTYGGEGYLPTIANLQDHTVDDVLASGGDLEYSVVSDFIFQLVFLYRNQPKVSIKLTPNPATPDKKGASQV